MIIVHLTNNGTDVVSVWLYVMSKEFVMKTAILSLVGLLCMSIPVVAEDKIRDGSITVTGRGEMSVTPDMATIIMTIDTKSDLSPKSTTSACMKEAIKKNAEKTKAILNSLTATHKIPTDDITTAAFNVYPQSHAKSDTITGYTATNTLAVRVRSIDKAGDVVGDLGEHARIQGVHLGISDSLRKTSMEKLRQLAIEDARTRAETFAKASGTKVGLVSAISENGNSWGNPGGHMEMASAHSLRADMPISAGKTTISTSVTMTFNMQQNAK